MQTNKVARNLRTRIGKFSGDLSKGLCVVAQRFVSEMVYGIQASQSVMLTEIARTLEEQTSIHKVEDRLSRNLRRPDLEETVQTNLLAMAAGHVDEDTLLIIDPSDIAKKYAKEMEFLGTVRDGSEKQLAQGYWTLHIMGAKVDSAKLTPLYQRLWSAKAPDFVSENEEIIGGIDAVCAHVGQRGLWIMDRGGDRDNLFEPMLDRGLRFLFRLVGNRNLIYNNQTLLVSKIAAECRCPFTKTITRFEDGKERVYTLRFGFRRVRLPDRPELLGLLVIHGFGDQPMMLLTTEPLRRNYKQLSYFISAYLRRWCIEETIRYIKTCYDLENVRVLKYQRLQNMMPLVLAAVFFAACILDHETRLQIMASHVERAAKRLFGVPEFKYYAFSDGIRALFNRHPGPPQTRIRHPQTHQLPLFAFDTS